MRVLKPGGKLVILEATYPESRMVRWGYRLYAPLVPLMGKLLGGGSAYKYLMKSIEDFPTQKEVVEMFNQAGFEEVGCRSMAFGSVSIFSGKK